MRAFIETLANVEKIEVLPYHAFGEYKWKQKGPPHTKGKGGGLPYTLSGVLPPAPDRVANAEAVLRGQKSPGRPIPFETIKRDHNQGVAAKKAAHCWHGEREKTARLP